MKSRALRSCFSCLAVALSILTMGIETSANQQLAYKSGGGTVGANPIVITPDGAHLYVTAASDFGPDLLVLDVESNTVQAVVPLSGYSNLLVINTTDNTVETAITAGDRPMGMAISPDGSRVYLADWANAVYVIDTETNTVTTTITTDIGPNPRQVAFTPDGTRAYLTNWNSPCTVAVIDVATETVTGNIVDEEGGICSTALAVSPDGAHVYVNSSSGSVAVIDTGTNEVIDKIAIGECAGTGCSVEARGIAITPDGTLAYTTIFEWPSCEVKVAVLDLESNTVKRFLHLEASGTPFISPDGTRLYITTGSEALLVVDISTDPETLIGTWEGVSPWGAMVFSPTESVESMIEALIQRVRIIDLKNGGGFTAKLQAALESFSKALANDFVNTINQLEAFKNKCDVDNQLADSDRISLIAEADAIIDYIQSML